MTILEAMYYFTTIIVFIISSLILYLRFTAANQVVWWSTLVVTGKWEQVKLLMGWS